MTPKFARFALALGALWIANCGHASAATADRPNVVLILADDLGWSDIGCYGADLHETPHLDRLAREGIRFTDAYAMSVCSPTRAALLTGKHAARLQMTIWSEGSLKGPANRTLLQADARHDLPHSEITLARILQDAGYLTALVGKWHLGDAAHYPETHGFNVNIGGTLWGSPHTFFWPYSGSGRYPEFRYIPHLEFGQPGEYLTDRLTTEALRVIDRAGMQPFFLYLAHYAPHTPIEAKAGVVRHFTEKLRPGLKHQNASYAAMIKSLDENVGRLLAALAERGLDKNTIVIFASDNGGYIGRDKFGANQNQPVTTNFPLRSGKGSLYEGGVRVPLMIRWPGVAPAGVVCSEPVILMDLFYTLRAALAPVPAGSKSTQANDGLDLRALLKNPSAKLGRDVLCFHYPHYYQTTTPVGAIRADDWKLLEYFEDNRVELYNLREDVGEEHDLADKNPSRVAQLRDRLEAWRHSVGAAMPKPNPAFK
jgi:arylsulfatase A